MAAKMEAKCHSASQFGTKRKKETFSDLDGSGEGTLLKTSSRADPFQASIAPSRNQNIQIGTMIRKGTKYPIIKELVVIPAAMILNTNGPIDLIRLKK
jgi:hypothetical protein